MSTDARQQQLAYTIRVSTRARSVRLRIRGDIGLEVVIPRGFPRSRVPEIVTEKRAWIERHLERTREAREARAAELGRVPERLCLRAVGEELDVVARPAAGVARGARASGGRIVVSEDPSDTPSVLNALRSWCAREARRRFVPMLADLAAEHGLSFQRVCIRSQRSRWGSCSSRGTISLNSAMLFLPPHLVRYVMLHELTHTERLDHSAAFWARLAERDPQSRAHAAEMRDAWAHVPGWLERPR